MHELFMFIITCFGKNKVGTSKMNLSKSCSIRQKRGTNLQPDINEVFHSTNENIVILFD